MPKYTVSKGYVFYNKFKQAFFEGEEVEVDQEFADKQAWKLIPKKAAGRSPKVEEKDIKDLVENRAIISNEDKRVAVAKEKKSRKNKKGTKG